MSFTMVPAKYDDARRAQLKKIADETLNVLNERQYSLRGVLQDISYRIRETTEGTKFHSAISENVSLWEKTESSPTPAPTQISVLQITTLDAARLLHNAYKNYPKANSTVTGVLNFASATKEGGGFLNGAEAQEESIARSSTLYCSLTTDEAAKFYQYHMNDSIPGNKKAYYSHAIVYSPKVTVFRDDDGIWSSPFEIDVLSCAAVNAGELRKKWNGPLNAGLEVTIEKEMKERMGRILYVFEQYQIRNLVLGTFGTGVFRNDVPTVARIWANLLIVQGARFKGSFDRIIFAITGMEAFADFQSAFEAWRI